MTILRINIYCFSWIASSVYFNSNYCALQVGVEREVAGLYFFVLSYDEYAINFYKGKGCVDYTKTLGYSTFTLNSLGIKMNAEKFEG